MKIAADHAEDADEKNYDDCHPLVQSGLIPVRFQNFCPSAFSVSSASSAVIPAAVFRLKGSYLRFCVSLSQHLPKSAL